MRHRVGVEGRLTLEEAYLKWSDDLVRYATALVGPGDAADVVADAFATQLRRGDDAWHSVREPRGYLFRSVTNAARMHHRGLDRRRRRELRSPTESTTSGEMVRDPMVLTALGGLSVRQRAVLFLTYWEDLSVGDVAGRLGISEGAVKRHLARGRAALRDVLGGKD